MTRPIPLYPARSDLVLYFQICFCLSLCIFLMGISLVGCARSHVIGGGGSEPPIYDAGPSPSDANSSNGTCGTLYPNAGFENVDQALTEGIEVTIQGVILNEPPGVLSRLVFTTGLREYNFLAPRDHLEDFTIGTRASIGITNLPGDALVQFVRTDDIVIRVLIASSAPIDRISLDAPFSFEMGPLACERPSTIDENCNNDRVFSLWLHDEIDGPRPPFIIQPSEGYGVTHSVPGVSDFYVTHINATQWGAHSGCTVLVPFDLNIVITEWIGGR